MENGFDYKKFKEGFKIDYPEYFNYAFDVIDKLADSYRNKMAMIWISDSGEERKFTFWDIKVLSNKIANLLQRFQVEKNTKVLVMLPRIPEWWCAMLGLMKVGAISVPSAMSLTPRDIEYRCNKAGIKMIITTEANAEKVESIRKKIPTVEHLVLVGAKREGWINFEENVEPASRYFVPIGGEKHTRATDPFLMYFTSGTTGYPKIVVHNYGYTLAHRSTAELWQDLKPSDIIWTITDTGWAKIAWGGFFGQWYAGATLFIWEYARFKTDRILEMLTKYGITVFCAPPTAYRMLILEDLKRFDYSELRRCVSAGEPLNPEVISVWKNDVKLEINEGYGQTETVLLAGNYPGMKVKYGSMGMPSPLFTLEIIDDDLKILPSGKEGHIAIKVKPDHPFGIFHEYLEDPDLNADVFKGDWYLTGDKGYKDEDGYIWFMGRSDDMIKSSDYRIGPFEVESALVEHDAVIEAAVIGIPDKIKGQRVKAFVVLSDEYQPSETLVKELQEHVKKTTAPYKYPREIEFVKDLPKTISGKIRRIELREREIKKTEEGNK
jgi:acetyl-CoA synthetase